MNANPRQFVPSEAHNGQVRQMKGAYAIRVWRTNWSNFNYPSSPTRFSAGARGELSKGSRADCRFLPRAREGGATAIVADPPSAVAPFQITVPENKAVWIHNLQATFGFTSIFGNFSISMGGAGSVWVCAKLASAMQPNSVNEGCAQQPVPWSQGY